MRKERWQQKDLLILVRRIFLFWWPQVTNPSSTQLLCQEHFSLCYYILHPEQPPDSLVIDRAQFMTWNGQMFSIYSGFFFFSMGLHFPHFPFWLNGLGCQVSYPMKHKNRKAELKNISMALSSFEQSFNHINQC